MSATVVENNGSDVFYDVNTNNLIGNTAVYYLFPPLELYNNNGDIIEQYRHTVDDRIVNKDIAFLKMAEFKDPNQDASFTDGTFKNTNMAAALHAIGTNDYFFKYAGTDTTIASPSLERAANIPKIAEVIKLPSASIGGTFQNTSLGMATPHINRFEDLAVEGLNEGFPPTGQQMIAARLESQDMEDVTYRCFNTATITAADATILNTKVITDECLHFTGIPSSFVDETQNEFVNEDVAFVENSSYVSAVEIVNVERDLDDLRYGDEEDNIPLQFTGAMHVFTDAELAKVELKQATTSPINIDVWGGDCFIGLHTFKVSDSAYVLTDPAKEGDLSGTAGQSQDQADRWGHWFDKGNGEDISRPIALKGVSQTITVLLESEINPEVAEKEAHNEYTDAIPVPRVDTAGQIRSKFDYNYNLDYARQNDYKIFFPYRSFEKNNTLYSSRLVYSDPKIYRSDIEGFDRFRVGNTYDLDETHGDLTKIILAANNLYALQEKGISYIPVDANAISTADGSSIQIRSGEIIGLPVMLDTKYGTQHPKTVQSDGKSIFFVDEFNGVVCRLADRGLEIISGNGMETYFNSILPATNQSDLIGIFDQKERQYIVSKRNANTAVYNAELGVWETTWDASINWTLVGGIYVLDNLYLVGFETPAGAVTAASDVMLATMYTSNTDAQFFGVNSTPSISFYVNPEIDMPKTFDNVILNATGQLSGDFVMTVPRAGTTAQTSTTTIPATTQEGTYRLKVLRDASGARMRGLNANYTFNWGSGQTTGYSLTAILTKYRPSYKSI